MDIHSVKQPTNREELKELNTLLRKYTSEKSVRAKMRRKIKYDGFTDLDLVWDSIHAPPPSAPEGAEPEEEESPQEDP